MDGKTLPVNLSNVFGYCKRFWLLIIIKDIEYIESNELNS